CGYGDDWRQRWDFRNGRAHKTSKRGCEGRGQIYILDIPPVPLSSLPPCMFEDVRRAFRDLLHGTPPSGDARRSILAQMRETLVQARMGPDDLRKGVEETRARLARERSELETVRRRRQLAEGIKDAETVAVAERYE